MEGAEAGTRKTHQRKRNSNQSHGRRRKKPVAATKSKNRLKSTITFKRKSKAKVGGRNLPWCRRRAGLTDVVPAPSHSKATSIRRRPYSGLSDLAAAFCAFVSEFAGFSATTA